MNIYIFYLRIKTKLVTVAAVASTVDMRVLGPDPVYVNIASALVVAGLDLCGGSDYFWHSVAGRELVGRDSRKLPGVSLLHKPPFER